MGSFVGRISDRRKLNSLMRVKLVGGKKLQLMAELSHKIIPRVRLEYKGLVKREQDKEA